MTAGSDIFRKSALLGATVLAGVLLMAGCALQNERVGRAQARPNIVFVMTDDQTESTLNHMPNVRSLIKQKGRTFNNAFNAYPLCCPSRAIIQRGQYAHNTGVFGNTAIDGAGGYPVFDQLDREKSTVATWLDAAGYRTVHMGKYMNEYNPQVDPPPPGWDVFGKPTAPYQGGQTFTATVANRAMAQLRTEAPKTEPFYLQVGFSAPHVTNDFESQYAGMFAGERVPRVPSFDEQDVSDKPRYIHQDKPPLAQQTNPEVSVVCRDNEVNSIAQNDCEYRFVKDAVDYLASQGELSNTYIVYYTDNGNHWGEHRLDYGKLAPLRNRYGLPPTHPRSQYLRGHGHGQAGWQPGHRTHLRPDRGRYAAILCGRTQLPQGCRLRPEQRCPLAHCSLRRAALQARVAFARQGLSKLHPSVGGSQGGEPRLHPLRRRPLDLGERLRLHRVLRPKS
jgi:N-acetylglucosamine-6-sulfatase